MRRLTLALLLLFGGAGAARGQGHSPEIVLMPIDAPAARSSVSAFVFQHDVGPQLFGLTGAVHVSRALTLVGQLAGAHEGPIYSIEGGVFSDAGWFGAGSLETHWRLTPELVV